MVCILQTQKLKIKTVILVLVVFPGYVIAIIRPNSYNVPRFPALIAHEFHHNLRFSYFEWNHGDVTVADYIIIEDSPILLLPHCMVKEF